MLFEGETVGGDSIFLAILLRGTSNAPLLEDRLCVPAIFKGRYLTSKLQLDTSKDTCHTPTDSKRYRTAPSSPHRCACSGVGAHTKKLAALVHRLLRPRLGQRFIRKGDLGPPLAESILGEQGQQSVDRVAHLLVQYRCLANGVA